MKRMKKFILLISIIFTVVYIPVAAAEMADPGWPRVFEKDKQKLTVYQPQVDYWKDYKELHIRCAIAVKPAKNKEEKYGIAEVDASTVVDQATRVVAIMPSKREIRFPNISASEETKLRAIVEKLLPPQQAMTVSLDRVLAYLDPAEQKNQRVVDVKLEPPKIFYSRTPAILVIFMGQPELKPVVPGKTELMFAVNTNWNIFYDALEQRYYLLNGESWLTAVDAVNGPWAAVTKLPKALSALPADDNWADVRKNIPGKSAKETPVVFAVTEPSELIVTKGEPTFAPIAGTSLMSVANTEAALFLHSKEGQYYFLVAGRWFRAKTLDGPWSVASNDLPTDFTNIPDNSPAAYAKVSVSGTRQAKDAVLLASVPKTITVNVAPVTEKVIYSGDPKFVIIDGTTVQYAVNTSSAVFKVGGDYYWCYQGAWLTSILPSGPWTFATVVPALIYTIPPTHPTYHVTYVVVSSYSPATVTYVYTSGYSGEYVAANGVLMFGMGFAVSYAIYHDHDDYYYHYHGPVYSYGCGAVYHHGYGCYYRSAQVYGPYGGAGRATAYNPYTGTYSRGAYAYGPAGSASVGQAYNPYTGGYAQGGRVNTAYGSAGRFYAEQGGESAWGGYRSNENGTAAGIRTSEGSGMAAWDTNQGQGIVAKDQEGNVYAGKDGNVYKKDSEGDWSSNDGSGWQDVEKPQPVRATPSTTAANRQSGSWQGSDHAQASAATASTRDMSSQQSTGSARTSSTNANVQSLNQQAQARDWGNQQSQRSSQYQSGGYSGSRSGGQSSRSSSGRSGGGRSR